MVKEMASQNPIQSDSEAKNDPEVSLKSINFLRLLSFLKPYKGRMAISILMLVVSTGLGLASPMVGTKLLDLVLRTKDMHQLNVMALLLAGIFFIKAIVDFFETYLMAYIGERIVYDLRTSLYRKLHMLSFDFFASRRVGDLVSRLSSDVTLIRTLLTTSIGTLLSSGMMLIGSIVLLIMMNPRFTLFILGLIPVLVGLAFFLGAKIEKGSTKLQDRLADSTVVAEEGLQAIRVVKSFGREDYEAERYDSVMGGAFQSSVQMAVNSSLFTVIMTFLGSVSVCAIIWFGGREVIAGRLDLPKISGFMMLGLMVAASLAGLATIISQINAAIGGIKRVMEIMDTVSTVRDESDAKELATCEGKIAFKNVSFSYDGNTMVLKDISLEIRAGEVLALVGPSGAGKSTIFNLIPRFYDPAQGTVCIDGCNLRSVTQASLRSQMAIVPQETVLFGGTVRENILYGRLGATEEEVIAAARAANAHEFILALPNQYESLVGERGMSLSGGQRQRIAIARAILKDPRVLLLDEATSALDNESEELVQDALNRLMESRTTIIIAHRLSTIKRADRIAVLDGGCLIELGTHEELLQINGMYARLYNMQFRDTVEDVASPIEAKQPDGQGGNATLPVNQVVFPDMLPALL